MGECDKCKMRESTHWIGGEAFVCERCYVRHVFQPRSECPSVPPPEVEVRCDNPVPWALVAYALIGAVGIALGIGLGWLTGVS